MNAPDVNAPTSVLLWAALGSAATALTTPSFRWEGFANAEGAANHLLGAVLAPRYQIRRLERQV